MNSVLLSLLRCPVCKGQVSPDGASLRCQGCTNAYTVRDGIPIMLRADSPLLQNHKEHAPAALQKTIRLTGKPWSTEFLGRAQRKLARPLKKLKKVGTFSRPKGTDKSYLHLLQELPEDSLGLDLGARKHRITRHCVTLDVYPWVNVDVVGDGHELPFGNNAFDFVWCNAVLEHVPYPTKVAEEITRILKPGALAFIQTPFMEGIHHYPHDYFRFTIQGLRVLFPGLQEVKCGVSAGPSQVLPDLLQQYFLFFSLTPSGVKRSSVVLYPYVLLTNCIVAPLRLLDYVLKGRQGYARWARAYYFVGRKN